MHQFLHPASNETIFFNSFVQFPENIIKEKNVLLAFKLFTAYFLTCKQPEPRYSNSWQTFKSSEERLCVLDLNQTNDTGTENLGNYPATKRFIASLGKAVITKAQSQNTT